MYYFTVSYPGKSLFCFLNFQSISLWNWKSILWANGLKMVNSIPEETFYVEVFFSLWNSDYCLSHLESFTPWPLSLVPCSQNYEQSHKSEWLQRCYCFTELYIFIGYFLMCTHGATIVKDSKISYSCLSYIILNLKFESVILHQERCWFFVIDGVLS